MMSLRVICGLGPPQSKILATPMGETMVIDETKIKKLDFSTSRLYKNFFMPLGCGISDASYDGFTSDLVFLTCNLMSDVFDGILK